MYINIDFRINKYNTLETRGQGLVIDSSERQELVREEKQEKGVGPLKEILLRRQDSKPKHTQLMK